MVIERFRAIRRSEDGATMVEFSLVITLLLIVVLGFIDFALALFEWNEASKAVQVGARLAAVSDPVASNLKTLVQGLNNGATPGAASADYGTISCDGADAAAFGSGGGCDTAAMDWIVYGNTDNKCGPPYPAGARPIVGMCDIFSQIQPNNVVVDYIYSGLGYAGRPGGPVPTIRVHLQGLHFKFLFLGGLLGFGDLTIPPMTATMTGEDLKK